MQRYYFDYNATTPLHPGLIDLITDWVRTFGNASSVHREGQAAKAIIAQARDRLARGLGCQQLELVFTSGASEANSTAFASALTRKNLDPHRREILISSVEHSSVLATADSYQAQGFVVRKIKVMPSGALDWDDFLDKISERTALVSVMFANNETGNIMPIGQIVQRARELGALVHCDAVQALGKAPVDLKAWQVDYASFSGHKFYALKGVGLLYVKKGAPFVPLIDGGGQERRRRAGTENVLGIASLGWMADQLNEVAAQADRLRVLRDEFESLILASLSEIEVHGVGAERISNTSNLYIAGVSGESLLLRLDLEGFAVSSGSACSSGSTEPSHVIRALGHSHEHAHSSVRISLGWFTTRDDVIALAHKLTETVQKLRDLRKFANTSHP